MKYDYEQMVRDLLDGMGECDEDRDAVCARLAAMLLNETCLPRPAWEAFWEELDQGTKEELVSRVESTS